MGEVTSLAAIRKQFDSEWVLLEDPVTDESLQVKSGRVLWHSKDRDEVYVEVIHDSHRLYCR
jgi:hypothetical protein